MVRSAKGGRAFLNKEHVEDNNALHPSELEFAHYLRGTLAGGHAAALFAHTLVCGTCRELLEAQLTDGKLVRGAGPFRRPDEPGC